MAEEKEKKEGEKEVATKEESGKKPIEEKEAKTPPKKETKEVIPEPKAQAKKTKKLNRLSLEEVEERLKKLETESGGLGSLYAQHLLECKRELEAKKESLLD